MCVLWDGGYPPTCVLWDVGYPLTYVLWNVGYPPMCVFWELGYSLHASSEMRVILPGIGCPLGCGLSSSKFPIEVLRVVLQNVGYPLLGPMGCPLGYGLSSYSIAVS